MRFLLILIIVIFIGASELGCSYYVYEPSVITWPIHGEKLFARDINGNTIKYGD